MELRDDSDPLSAYMAYPAYKAYPLKGRWCQAGGNSQLPIKEVRADSKFARNCECEKEITISNNRRKKMPRFEKKDFDNLKKQIKKSIKEIQESNLNFHDFTALKFCKTASWPYPVAVERKESKCNFIEFINQLFTTVASVKAIEYLQAEKKDWEMCLGTTTGRDLTIFEKNNKIKIAEIFAVTDPTSNRKLKNEIISLVTSKNDEVKKTVVARYIFFILAENDFAHVKEKAQNWTNYTPSKDKQSKQKPIVFTDPVSSDSTFATWKCECDEKEICIICWSSKDCLDDFLSQLKK